MNPFLYFDLLSPKKVITLGNDMISYKTQLGAMFSILAIITTIVTTQDIFNSYINKEIPKETVDFSLDSSKYVYKSKELPLLFGFASSVLFPTFKMRIVNRTVLEKAKDFPFLSHVSVVDVLKNKVFTQKYGELTLCNTTELEIKIDEYRKKNPEMYKYEKKFWKQYLKQSIDSLCIDESSLYLETGLNFDYKGKIMALSYKNEQISKFFELEQTSEQTTIYSAVISHPKY